MALSIDLFELVEDSEIAQSLGGRWLIQVYEDGQLIDAVGFPTEELANEAFNSVMEKFNGKEELDG